MNELTPKIRPTVPQSLKGNVISQINKRKIIMRNIRNYSAIAAIVAVLIYFPFFSGNIAQAKSIELIEESILKTDEIKSMVLTYSMRNPFTYNPDVIEMNSQMNDMTAKIIFEQPTIWRFSSKNKWYIFDGNYTYWHSNAYDYCLVGVKNSESDFDKSDLGKFNALFLNPTTFMETVRKLAENKKSKIDVQNEGDSIILTINQKVKSIDKNRFGTGDIFGWYHSNYKYSFTTDCQQIFVFNKDTKLLKNFYVSVFYNNKYITVLKSKKIEYNVPIDKSELLYVPKELPKHLLSSQKYLVNMSSKQAVEKLLNAFKTDTTGYAIKDLPVERKIIVQNWIGMEILEISDPIIEEGYVGEIIPCKLKLKNGETIETKLAVRNDNEFKIWILDVNK